MTSVWKSCSSFKTAFKSAMSVAKSLTCGNLVQLIWSRPSSSGMKTGFGAVAANELLPTPGSE